MRYNKDTNELPHEFHITISHDNLEIGHINIFKKLCEDLGGKAMDIVGIDSAGKEVQRDVMYSGSAVMSHKQAHARAFDLASKINAALFVVTRVKVETVAFCARTEKLEILDPATLHLKRNAPSNTLPYGHYFEAHFAVEPPQFPSLVWAGCRIFFSYDRLREKRKWIATVRNYSVGPQMFKEIVSKAITVLGWAGWKTDTVDKVDFEYAILDTNPEMDAGWLGERS